MRRNYQQKLIQEIIRRNYHTKLSASILCRGKYGNYRDTGVSKNIISHICYSKHDKVYSFSRQLLSENEL